MTPLRLTVLVCLILVTLLSACTKPPAVPTRSAFDLEWRALNDLPDPVGLKGMYAGTSAGRVILAGGSNFPVPQNAGGRKTFHRRIYVQPLPVEAARAWIIASDELSIGLGEGAAVSTEHGVVCIGGHDGSAPVASVLLLRWDPQKGAIEQRVLPNLPEACASGAAALLHGSIYVAGGQGARGALGTLWRLDLERAVEEPAAARWETLPPWPGPPRFGSILNVTTTRSGERLLLAAGLPGAAKSQADYLRDAWLFDPAAQTWTQAAQMPRGAVLAAAFTPTASSVLVLGGSDGHDFERMKELGERYRIPDDVLVYESLADRWTTAGAMPLGAVGAAVVDLGGSWLVAGGEYSPGLRTSRVFELKVRTR